MQKEKKGLGRGLNIFFGEDTEMVEEVARPRKSKTHKELEKVVELNITEIEPMLNQPRKIFDKEKLQELTNSIKENGVIQPILVVKDENGYTIVAGERRWRAAKNAGLKEIPAIIKDYTDVKKKQVALIENIQREDLNVIEIANALKELMEIEGYSQNEVAKVTGKSVPAVSNIMRLLKLPGKILDYILQGKLVEGQARALLAVNDEKKQIEIAEKIIEKRLTVREVEKLIYGAEEYERKQDKKQPKTVYYQKLEEKLKNYFGYKVKIDSNKKHQKLVIEYNDDDGLESLLSKLNIKM
ncbi:MAG: ParB/RepB/Spo0J family partition protein [Clostridia bacterium]|nr:ParB/RepB/Spo0J family partition protein [Clostridia bacterium]